MLESAQKLETEQRPTSRLLRIGHHVFWALLFVVTPLLLDPSILWATSIRQLGAIAFFRGSAAWVLLLLGIVLAVASRPEATFRQVVRSVPRLALPFKFLWGFIGVVFLSTFFSNYFPGVPALGTPNRADGTVMQIAWFAMALVSAEVAGSSTLRPGVLLRYLALGSTATSTWILLQARGADPLTFVSRTHFHFQFAAGAFGHGGVATAYLAVCLIAIGFTWVTHDRLAWWQVGAVALLGAGMVAAGGRAGILGFVVAGAVLLVRVLRSGKHRRNLLILGIATLLGGVGGYAAAPHARYQAAITSGAVRGAGLGESIASRLVTWKVALRVIAAHPIFGVGPEGFGYLVWPYASQEEQRVLLAQAIGFEPAPGDYHVVGDAIVYTDPATGKMASRRYDWGKAHDYYLDIALATGVPSLLLFLGFLGSLFWILLGSREIVARNIGLALLAFSVWGLAWFYAVSLDPIVWGVVGMGLGLHWRRDRRSGAS